ncbi:MAG: DUF3379 family protein [Gammaproteobacteria bacterium]|nr:DUF3379 family protein [Gammaproteobacteria bacterium]
MTHNKHYRIAAADPNCQDHEFLAAIAADPALAGQVEQTQQLDSELSFLFDMPQPSQQLTNSLLDICNTKSEQPIESVEPTMTPELPAKKNNRFGRVFAIAASFAIAAVSFTVLQNQQFLHPDLSTHALAHSEHGASFAGVINERPSIDSVNYRLASFGAKFSDDLSNLTWFNGCSFDGISSLHLVFAGKQGPINVFIVPKSSKFELQSQYSNATYQGIGHEYNDAYMMIVGLKNEKLAPFQQKIDQAIHWNI